MKIFRSLTICAALAGGLFFASTNSASAQFGTNQRGYQLHIPGNNYSRQYRYGVEMYPRRLHYQWHDTSHYDYRPGYLWQHGNHYHYEPGQYRFHNDGHWDVHRH